MVRGCRWFVSSWLTALFFLIEPGIAAAQDADGDGVPNAQDECPGTPAAAAVDGAGCRSTCNAQMISGDAFARTHLAEIGLANSGAFGSMGGAPSGYHPRVGPQLGLAWVSLG